MKILDKHERPDWEYDGEVDVLYLSVGRRRKAVGVDIGQGVIVRYDERRRQVLGVTITGVRARLVESLNQDKSGGQRTGGRGRVRRRAGRRHRLR